MTAPQARVARPLREDLPLPYRPPQPERDTSTRARRLAAVVGTATLLTGLGIGVGVARADTSPCVEKWTAQNWEASEATLICEALYGTTRDGADPDIDQCVYADRADDVMENVRKYQRNAKALSRSMESAVTASHISRSTCEMNAARTSMSSAPTGGVTETRRQDPAKAEYESGYTAERVHRQWTSNLSLFAVVGGLALVGFGVRRWLKSRAEKPAHTIGQDTASTEPTADADSWKPPTPVQGEPQRVRAEAPTEGGDGW